MPGDAGKEGGGAPGDAARATEHHSVEESVRPEGGNDRVEATQNYKEPVDNPSHQQQPEGCDHSTQQTAVVALGLPGAHHDG